MQNYIVRIIATVSVILLLNTLLVIRRKAKLKKQIEADRKQWYKKMNEARYHMLNRHEHSNR